jgi:uroporphyrinogen decarboxylase
MPVPDPDPPPSRPASRAAPLPAGHPLRDGRTTDAPLLRAYRGLRTAHRPVWFMRQAGRSLPEYRAARADTDMLDACLTPDLAAELTLQPVRRHGVDAAILFSDIVVPLRLAGVAVTIVPGRGPVVAEPVRTAADVARLPELDPAALAPIARAAALVAGELGGVPLIGFAGAPFTVASYLVEGGPSRDQLRTRAMMHADPDAWHALAGWVARGSAAFLRAQVLAGASAVQLFDSWAGGLSRTDYLRYVMRHSAEVFTAVADLEVPRVHFGLGTGALLSALAAAGADVVGVDHRTALDEAIDDLGGAVPVQGNIDPALLFAGERALHAHADAVLAAGAGAPGHVVNLGHGVPPDTDPGVLTALVEHVHAQADPHA